MQHRFPKVQKPYLPQESNNKKQNKKIKQQIKENTKQNKLETPSKAKISFQQERLGDIKVCYVPEWKILSNLRYYLIYLYQC